MKKISAALALSILLLGGAGTLAHTSERHIKVDLESANGSGVTGFVQLTQLPKGGANLNVVAHGLEPGTVYTSFYYESADCTEPADELASFTADDQGEGHVNGKIDDDLDEVGSVSVRLGPDYGTLQACAKVH